MEGDEEPGSGILRLDIWNFALSWQSRFQYAKSEGHVGANEKVGGARLETYLRRIFLTFYYHSLQAYKLTGVTELSQNDVHNDLIKLFRSIWPMHQRSD